jgi:chromosome partitioning protein
LAVIGVLPTLFDSRTTHGRTVVERIGDDYGVTVLSPAIPRSVRFAEAPAVGQTVLRTARTSKGAAAYRDLAAHLLRI